MNPFPNFDHIRIEGCPATVTHQLHCAFESLWAFKSVRYVTVKRVRHRQYSGAEWNVLSAQSVWITLAVETFMVSQDRVRDGIRKLDIGNDVGAKLRMHAHFAHFLRCEGTPLVQNKLRNREFADVVE